MHWPIDKLKEWRENPRTIGSDEYELLKKKIKRWGQFKPLVVTEDGMVLGGNMRLKAFKEMGITEVWVSVVKPKDRAEMIEIALADNELSGQWNERALKDLIMDFPEIELSDYKFNFGIPQSLAKITGIKETDLPSARDSLTEKEMICPHCGKKIFVIV
jgi:ParB-like chromosome segregation protein Spo0J